MSNDIFLDFNELKNYNQFSYYLFFSREQNAHKINKGYIQNKLFDFLEDSENPLVYTCGNPNMIEEIRQKCNQIGLLDFISDAFVDT